MVIFLELPRVQEIFTLLICFYIFTSIHYLFLLAMRPGLDELIKKLLTTFNVDILCLSFPIFSPGKRKAVAIFDIKVTTNLVRRPPERGGASQNMQ
ncbi:hypothetical protein P168DRAFT_58603 [Aspergillus campestris IBT 28561]|uniref:Uncharacterized protein n=1 Tax=Aspergillus campestris (strain IBT 28561) TaxID=1392248 RepID=A0A2I1CTV5_ASPC2|nr:uncharacterized protein P168DRAFT_58603 [Aspergillus campestris IBT 28561]PKY01060.1 hypothetical protein P168DRAFT_58603 [Aspergillus campestris IBT 28561]